MAPERHADDLHLASACAQGDPHALAVFDEQYLARVPSYLAWLREPATQLEVLRSQLRAYLLATGESRPPLLAYDGAGSLHDFVRVAAVRQAMAQRALHTSPPTISSSWHALPVVTGEAGDCPSDARLAHYLEQGDSARAEIAPHLERCATCRELVSLTALSIEETTATSVFARGDQIGRYVVLGVAGKGAMGIVYAAYDAELDRKVALKLLNRGDPADTARRARIVREAQAMARVTHPNVVPAYEVGELDGRIFLAMEYVEGATLRSWQSAAGRTWEDVIRAYVAAGDGLLAAHRAGLVHRDFKPDNVLVGADGRPRVADFGLARVEGAITLIAATAASGDDPALTIAGAILGTPAYMAPEQLRGEAADARSDQFSFCVALYEALHGAPPFAGTSVAELTASISSDAIRPIPPSSPVPPPIERALRRGLAANPAERFPSMAELLAALSFDPRRDPAAAPVATQRLLLAGMMLLLVGTTFVANVVFAGSEPISVAGLFQLGVLSLGVMLGLALFLRRRLQSNSFHWGMMRIAAIITGQMAVLRWIGLVANLELRWILAMDLTAYAAGLATVSWLYVPSGWPAVGICLAGAAAVVNGYLPLLWAQWVYPFATIVVFVPWYRAAGVRSPTTASNGGG